ncbi:MAG: N-acetylmuramoyl-L-alanine amidase, partial [Actinomycetota bacterium]
MRRVPPLIALRIAVPLATLAAVLVPSPAAPARTISVPVTLAGRVRPAPGRSVALDFPATHVGFSWRGEGIRGVRYRVVRSDGDASRWLRAPESHDLEAGERHFSGVHWVGRAERIEWRPAGRSSERPSLRLRGARAQVGVAYMNTLDGPTRHLQVPAAPPGARAAARTPRIVTRARWGANESLKRTGGGCRRSFHPLQQLFVHHTAGSNFDSHPRATMRAIYQFHTSTRGWCDIGYNFVIAPNGSIFEGRWARRYAPWETHDSEDRAGRVVTGAHVSNFNSGSLGVSMMGNFSRVSLSPAARRSLAELLAWESDRHNLRPRGEHRYRNPESGRRKRLPTIAGHRDAGSTECPGNLLYRSLDGVRRDTRAVMGAGKSDTRLSLTPSDRRISWGDGLTLSGRLTGDSGAGLPGRKVTLYRRPARRVWEAEAAVTTTDTGNFSVVHEPKRHTAVVAVFNGGGSFWGSESDRVRLRVRPLVTLEPRGGQPDGEGTVYPPETRTVRLAGSVTPPHRDRRVRVRVSMADELGNFERVTRRRAPLNARGRYRFEFR